MLLAPDPEMMMMPRMASAAWLAPQGPRALGAGAGAALLPWRGADESQCLHVSTPETRARQRVGECASHDTARM